MIRMASAFKFLSCLSWLSDEVLQKNLHTRFQGRRREGRVGEGWESEDEGEVESMCLVGGRGKTPSHYGSWFHMVDCR